MNGKELVQYLTKSFLSGSLKTILVALSTIVLLPIVINKVGIENYGLLSLIMIFGGVSVLADFGISKSVTILIGEKNSDLSRIISSALVINVTILISIICLLVIFDMNGKDILGSKLDLTTDLKNYIVVMGVMYLTFILFNNLLVAVLEALFLVHYINIGFIISSLSINCYILGISFLSDSLNLLFLAPVLSISTVCIYFLIIVRLNCSFKLVLPKFKELKAMLIMSFKFMKLGAINSLVIPVNKYLIIAITGNSALLGIFDIGLKIALIALSFLNSITQPLMAVFSNSNHNKNNTGKIVFRVSVVVFGLYCIGMFLFFVTGNFLISFIDAENAPSLYSISWILLLGVGFSAVSEPAYKAMLGNLRLNEALYLKLSIPLFNIVFYLLLQNEPNQFSLAYSLAMFLSSLFIIFYFFYTSKKN